MYSFKAFFFFLFKSPVQEPYCKISNQPPGRKRKINEREKKVEQETALLLVLPICCYDQAFNAKITYLLFLFH